MNQLSHLAFSASKCYNSAVGLPLFLNLAKIQDQIMTNNIEIINAAVTLIIKAAILAARFSGRARKRSLKRLSKMDADDKEKEIIFLRDKVNQQQMQITILQKGIQKKQTNNRYRKSQQDPQIRMASTGSHHQGY
jgi:hypothetical protein